MPLDFIIEKYDIKMNFLEHLSLAKKYKTIVYKVKTEYFEPFPGRSSLNTLLVLDKKVVASFLYS